MDCHGAGQENCYIALFSNPRCFKCAPSYFVKVILSLQMEFSSMDWLTCLSLRWHSIHWSCSIQPMWSGSSSRTFRIRLIEAGSQDLDGGLLFQSTTASSMGLVFATSSNLHCPFDSHLGTVWVSLHKSCCYVPEAMLKVAVQNGEGNKHGF